MPAVDASSCCRPARDFSRFCAAKAQRIDPCSECYSVTGQELCRPPGGQQGLRTGRGGAEHRVEGRDGGATEVKGAAVQALNRARVAGAGQSKSNGGVGVGQAKDKGRAAGSC